MTETFTGSVKQRLFSGTLSSLVIKIIAFVFGFIANVMLARLLSPSDLGIYYLTFSFVSVLSLVASLGLGQTVVRFIAENVGSQAIEKAYVYLRCVLLLVCLGVLTTTLFVANGVGELVALSLFNSDSMTQVIPLICLWVLPFSLLNVLAEVFRGFQNFRFAVFLKELSKNAFLSIALLYPLLTTETVSLPVVFSLAIIATVIPTVIAIYALPRDVWKVSYKYLGLHGRAAKSILYVSLPILVTELLLFSMGQANLWIAGAVLTENDVAIYGAVLRLVTILSMSLVLINAVLPPLIAEFNSDRELKKIEKLLRGSAFLVGIPSAFVLLIYIFFGQSILGIVYGEFYTQGFLVLSILSAGCMFGVWAGSCQQVLMMTGYQTDLMIITALSGFVNVSLAYYLAQSYGIEGIAIAASVGLFIMNLLSLFSVKIRLDVWTHASISPSILNSAYKFAITQVFLKK